MARTKHITKTGQGSGILLTTAVLGCLLLGVARGDAQTAASPASRQDQQGEVAAAASGAAFAEGEVLDRVLAVVNGDLVLESDVEEEKRFSSFQPLRIANAEFSRAEAIERLINRTLILQQLKLQPQPPITEAALDTEVAQLRKDVPECKSYHCETDAGWAKFVADQGFTMAEFRERWRQRMEVLRFIEQRFRMGVRIEPTEIKDYYNKTLLPQYAKQKVAPPKLDAVSARIEEVLLQQQVGSLLGDWLKSLRAQGSVRIITSGQEVAQ